MSAGALASLVVFALVAGAIVGAYWVVVARSEGQEQSALRRRLRPETVALSHSGLVRDAQAMSSIGPLNRLLQHHGAMLAPVRQVLGDSGLPVTVAHLLLGSLTLGLLLAVIVMFFTGMAWVAGVTGLAAGVLPLIVVRAARTRRIRQFEEQFPEAVDLIARSLRAGHAFATGVHLVADELGPPAGPEFKMLYERQRYGAELPDALKTFARRIPSPDARFFVTAVLTQREAGGNLSEVLDRLGSVMRERFRIRREVRVRSAHGRMTAGVLAGLPPVLALLMCASDPTALAQMARDPLGLRLLIAAGVLEVLGLLVIRKLVNIEY